MTNKRISANEIMKKREKEKKQKKKYNKVPWLDVKRNYTRGLFLSKFK